MSEYARIEISIANTHSPVRFREIRAEPIDSYTPESKRDAQRVAYIRLTSHTVCGAFFGG